MTVISPQDNGFETVFRDSKDGLAILKNEVFVDCNQSMLDIVGAESREQFVGFTPFDFSPEMQPDGRSSYEKGMAMIQECLEAGSVRFEWLHRKLNDQTFWVEVIITKMVLNGEIVLHTNWRDISKKKELELETQAQKVAFETLFNESEDGLCLLTSQAYFDCNKAFTHMFGAQDKREIIGISPIDISPEFQPDGRRSDEKAAEIIKTAFTQDTIRFEWMHKKFDGTEFWCEIVLFRITLNDQDVLYASTRDISEKKTLQLEIAKQKDSFEQLFKESKDGLSIIADGLFYDCNNSFVELFGYGSVEEVVGLTPLQVSAPIQEDGESVETAAPKRIASAFAEGSARFEWNHLRKDGSMFWGEVILTRIIKDGREVLYGITRDMSAKRALQQEIAQQKATFEALFNESKDSLSLISDGYFIDCNNTFLTMFGFSSREQVVGLTPMDISPQYQQEGLTTAEAAKGKIGMAFTDGSARFEWLHTRADGVDIWCEVILTKIKLNDEDVLYAITRDISEKKKLELDIIERNAELKASNENLEHTIENLKLMQKKLVESEKMASLGSLVAGVAHEINTPVGVGLTGVTQLKDECNSIRQRYEQGLLDENSFNEFLASVTEISDIVNKNLERTAHLVRSFKQVAVDQTSEEDRQVNIKYYCEEVVFSLASVLRKASVEVKIDCADDYNVLTNPGLLSQVLTNLIVNSVKHGFSGRESGAIQIHITAINDTEFVMTYQDNGKGISAENAPKIFDPFFTTGRDSGGTGLGLNITYNIVTNALGGSIVCHSQEGYGVEFVIQFKVSARL